MTRAVAIILGLTATVVVCTALREYDRNFDRAAWHADIDALAAQMSTSYANLEWSVQSKAVDPSALLAKAHAEVDDASSDRGGKNAVANFLEAFSDPHIKLGDRQPESTPASIETPSSTSEPVATGFSTTSSAAKACSKFGYGSRDKNFHGSVRSLRGFRTIAASRYFRTAFAESNSGGAVALLRLPHTSQDGWKTACEDAWPAVAARHPSGCGNRCEYQLWIATGDTLLADLALAFRTFHDSSATTLLVDLTDNGGGSEWAEAVARTLGPHGLPNNIVGMVRGTHWEREMTNRLRKLDSVIAFANLPAGLSTALQTHRRHVDSLRKEVATPCGYAAVWKNSPPPCSPLVRDAAPLAAPLDSLRTWGAPATLLRPTNYRFVESAWGSKLLLLTNSNTASAAEQITALLVDFGSTQSVGEQTMGAGCGFTNGGIRFVLPNSRLLVRLPDCARLRRNGENERAGIAPTIMPAWTRSMNSSERANELRNAVARVHSSRGAN